jgi:hypothetical protein
VRREIRLAADASAEERADRVVPHNKSLMFPSSGRREVREKEAEGFQVKEVTGMASR